MGSLINKKNTDKGTRRPNMLTEPQANEGRPPLCYSSVCKPFSRGSYMPTVNPVRLWYVNTDNTHLVCSGPEPTSVCETGLQ